MPASGLAADAEAERETDADGAGDGDVTGAAGTTGFVAGAGVEGFGFRPSPSDFSPNNPGIENKNAIRKKTTAATTVTLARTVLV
ncbi:MAG: hypothetical protein ACRD16_13705, partial [Thermoanaerobaculia bacterium]